MKKILAILAVLLVFGFSVSANAASTGISVGIDIYGDFIHSDNADFNDNASDALTKNDETVNLWIKNDWTSKVKTIFRLDGKKINDADSVTVTVDRAYIEMKEFINKNLTVSIGKLSWTWELRKSWGAGAFKALNAGSVERAFVFKVKPVGISLQYAFSDATSFGFGWGKRFEGSVIGNNANDTDVYYVRLDYKFAAKTKMMAGFIYLKDTAMVLKGDTWYLDLGVETFGLDDCLELYAEFVHQNGEAHNPADDYGAIAFDLGGEYTFKNVEMLPYVGLDITYYQGNEGNKLGYQRIGAVFCQTLIAEDSHFFPNGGWNKTNTASPFYRSGWIGFKVMGGLKKVTEKVGIDAVVAFYTADGDVPAGTDSGLGTEIDVFAKYLYSDSTTFGLGLGYFIPNEDLGGADPDSMLAIVIGVGVKF